MRIQPAYETAAVLFLDILGTKDRISFDQKFAIHQLFHDEWLRNAARQEQSPHVVYTRELRSFSDCVYIFYRYKGGISKERKDNLNLLYICLYNTSLSLLRILQQGFLVRGGATLGDCFIDDFGFFGPAVECAYGLESEQAVYPRVLLNNEIGADLFRWEQEREPNEVFQSLFTEMPRLIVKDCDGRFYLNVFFELERSETVDICDQTLEISMVKEQILKGIAYGKIRHRDNQGIVAKLEWMRKFTENLNSKLKTSGSARTIVLGP